MKAIRPLEGDVSKLPQWAQRRIEVLEMRLREARQDIAEMHGEAATNVFLVQGMREDAKPLIKDACIRFVLPGGEVSCRIEDDTLRITGDPTLRVLPCASNVVNVTPKRLK